MTFDTYTNTNTLNEFYEYLDVLNKGLDDKEENAAVLGLLGQNLL